MSATLDQARPSAKNPTLLLDVQSIDKVLDTAVSPFAGPQLHPEAAAQLMLEARGFPGAERLDVVFRVPLGSGGRVEDLRKAVQRFGLEESIEASKIVKEIMKDGRYALLIGAVAVSVLRGLAELLLLVGDYAMLKGLSESLVIFYWVILWRPAELLLYEHIAPRRRAKLGRLLERATVRTEYVDVSELGT